MSMIKKLSEFLELNYLSEKLSSRNGLIQGFSDLEKTLLVIMSPFLVVLSNVLFSLFCIVLSLIMSLLSGLSVKNFLLRTLFFIPVFSLIIALPRAFMMDGTILYSVNFLWWGLRLTKEGLWIAFLFTLKVWAALSIPVIIVTVSGFRSIVNGFSVFHFPKIFTELLIVTYVNIYSMVRSIIVSVIAFESRTVKRVKLKFIGLMFGYQLVKGYERSERVYMAMLSRGGFNMPKYAVSGYNIKFLFIFSLMIFFYVIDYLVF